MGMHREEGRKMINLNTQNFMVNGPVKSNHIPEGMWHKTRLKGATVSCIRCPLEKHGYMSWNFTCPLYRVLCHMPTLQTWQDFTGPLLSGLCHILQTWSKSGPQAPCWVMTLGVYMYLPPILPNPSKSCQTREWTWRNSLQSGFICPLQHYTGKFWKS